MKLCVPFLTAQLFLSWLWVFSAPRVGAGLGIPWSGSYLWCWDDAGKHVNPVSAFRSLPSFIHFWQRHWVESKGPSRVNISC